MAYKYPYIPKEYYPAVMFACSCIRKYGTFNVAIQAAANKYGLDEEEIAKHVRKRQGAGQKGTTRKYKWFLVMGYTDEYRSYHDYSILWSQDDPHDWEKNREKVAKIIKATSKENAEKQIPNGNYDPIFGFTGFCISHYDIIQCETEEEAKNKLQEIKKAAHG